MKMRRTMLGLAATLLVAAAAGEAQAQSGPPNYSSHDAAFFETLLTDRVWLFERPSSARARKTAEFSGASIMRPTARRARASISTARGRPGPAGGGWSPRPASGPSTTTTGPAPNPIPAT